MNKKILGAQSATAGEAAGSIAPDAAIARHTAGPWTALGIWEKEGSNGGWSVEADGDIEVAFLYLTETRVNAEADAHLIAAAPELKAELVITDPLCQQLATVAMHPEVERFLPFGLLDQVKAWLANSRGHAAIRKAEGRS